MDIFVSHIWLGMSAIPFEMKFILCLAERHYNSESHLEPNKSETIAIEPEMQPSSE